MLTHDGPNSVSQSPVCIIHVNWSAYQFPRSDKRDCNATWRSANSTRSVVGLCSCCFIWRRAHVNQLPHAATGPLDVLGTGVIASCSPLPSRHSPGRVIRKSLCAQAAQQRCVEENVSVNTRRHVRGRTLLRIRVYVCGHVRRHGQRRRIHKRTPTRPWKRLQAYTHHAWRTWTLPCIKLQTLLSRCLQLPMARLDTNHLQMPADVDGISGGSENVCVGTSLVCSLAGHDSHHREPISLLQLI